MNMEITHRNNGTLTGNSLIMWKIIYWTHYLTIA
jgi:hypothetical protein